MSTKEELITTYENVLNKIKYQLVDLVENKPVNQTNELENIRLTTICLCYSDIISNLKKLK